MLAAREDYSGQGAEIGDERQRDGRRCVRIVGEPGAGFATDRLGKRIGERAAINGGGDDVAVDAEVQPDAGDRKTRDEQETEERRSSDRALLDDAFGPVREVVGAVEGDHRRGDDAADERERVEQSPERAGVVRDEVFVEVEGHALQQVAEGDAEDQRRHGAADEQAPVPRRTPARVVDLAAVVEADRPEEERPEHGEHRPVEARERGCINERPGGEDGAAAGDEPHLVAVPVRTDGVDDDAPFGVAAPDEGQQRADAHVVPVHDGEADEQHADEQPPDDFQRFVVDH